MLERYAYAAFGKPTFLTHSYGDRSTSSYDWETLSAGYRWEPQTAHFHVRYRLLSSLLGRWLQRDPLDFTAGLSHYAYLSSNPMHAVDPLGLIAGEGKYKCCKHIFSITYDLTILLLFDEDKTAIDKDVDALLKIANGIWQQCCIRLSEDKRVYLSQESSAKILGDDSTLDSKRDDYIISAELKELTKNQPDTVGHKIYAYLVPLVTSGENAVLRGFAFVPGGTLRGFSVPPYPGFVVEYAALQGRAGLKDAAKNRAKVARTFAHEFGHIFGLPHVETEGNLMVSGETGTKLTEPQCDQATSSPFLAEVVEPRVGKDGS